MEGEEDVMLRAVEAAEEDAPAPATAAEAETVERSEREVAEAVSVRPGVPVGSDSAPNALRALFVLTAPHAPGAADAEACRGLRAGAGEAVGAAAAEAVSAGVDAEPVRGGAESESAALGTRAVLDPLSGAGSAGAECLLSLRARRG